jgi:hypothetical protein
LNQGTWVVERVGVSSGVATDDFTVLSKFKVSTADRAPQPFAAPDPLGTESSRIQVIEEKPLTLFKRILGIVTDPTNPSFVDVTWDNSTLLDRISATAGSIISPIDKLAFSTTPQAGVDGYSYSIGLIGEANRVVYGDPSDTATYPAVAAAGAQINIQGPLIRRIQLALNLRTKTGVTRSLITDRVRSAVAAAVNQIPLGQPVAISTIIKAATSVPGVVAVSVLSPLYTVGRDLIPVQPYEKPLILNLEQDIGITFSGD